MIDLYYEVMLSCHLSIPGFAQWQCDNHDSGYLGMAYLCSYTKRVAEFSYAITAYQFLPVMFHSFTIRA